MGVGISVPPATTRAQGELLITRRAPLCVTLSGPVFTGPSPFGLDAAFRTSPRVMSPRVFLGPASRRIMLADTKMTRDAARPSIGGLSLVFERAVLPFVERVRRDRSTFSLLEVGSRTARSTIAARWSPSSPAGVTGLARS